MAYKARFDESRGFGIEIEIYDADKHEIKNQLEKREIASFIAVEDYNSSISYWAIVDEGGILEYNVAELVSPILYGRKGLQEVKRVLEILNKLNCKVNNSCGLHIHWNAQDFTGNNLLSLLKLYTKFECVIDQLVAPHRRDNNCRHAQNLWKESDLSWIDALGKNKLAIEIADKFQQEYSLENTDSLPSARHHKLNICSILEYGTVEFRQHHGTLDVEEVILWAIFTQLLVTKAKESVIDNHINGCTFGALLRSLGIAKYQLKERTDFMMAELILAVWLKKRKLSV